jgi:hypothetical protein
VTTWRTTFTVEMPFNSPLSGLQVTDDDQYVATWHRTTWQAHYQHWKLLRTRGRCLSLTDFQQLVPTFRPVGANSNIVLTHAPNLEELLVEPPFSEFAGWRVDGDEVVPFSVALEPEAHGLVQLAPHWRLDALRDKRVLVVGVGSLGSVVASSLAGYGVGSLDLLDPDRLLWHNTVRHVLGDEHVGRFKVDALAQHLTARWPDLTCTPHVIDVVQDAHLVRALIKDVDAIVCAADGIAPRRVVSHLAARARVDAVLASVLEDGAYGEVIRLRPAPDHGCLLCRRALSYETGQMDPERVQERGYGDGDPHRPMTAVGPDLSLIGNLAAKVVVASLLDRHGESDQRLPGEQAVISLRPAPGYEAPFDIDRSCEIRWAPATPPRPGCFTCTRP